jgi:hypothetical protein
MTGDGRGPTERRPRNRARSCHALGLLVMVTGLFAVSFAVIW